MSNLEWCFSTSKGKNGFPEPLTSFYNSLLQAKVISVEIIVRELFVEVYLYCKWELRVIPYCCPSQHPQMPKKHQLTKPLPTAWLRYIPI